MALPTIMPSMFLFFNPFAFLISLIEETPPEITTGQLDIAAIFNVSSKFGLSLVPSLSISV
jgi:hypothetical protein